MEFVQLADIPFGYVGSNWKEDVSDKCVIHEETLRITACVTGNITRSIHWKKGECKDEIIVFALRTFKEWGVSVDMARDAITVDREIPSDVLEAFMYISKYGYIRDIPPGQHQKIAKNHMRVNESMKFQRMLNREEHASPEQSIAVITHETGKQQPVIVSGCVDVEDRVMLLKMHDKYGRTLGIIVDENYRRKGTFLHTKANVEEGLVYRSYDFLL